MKQLDLVSDVYIHHAFFVLAVIYVGNYCCICTIATKLKVFMGGVPFAWRLCLGAADQLLPVSCRHVSFVNDVGEVTL